MLQNMINYKEENLQTLQETLYFIVYSLFHWGKIHNLFRVEECLNRYRDSAPKARIFSCWRMPGDRCCCPRAAMQMGPGVAGCKGSQGWGEGHTPGVISTEVATAKASLCLVLTLYCSRHFTRKTFSSHESKHRTTIHSLFRKGSWTGEQGRVEWFIF